MIGPTANSSIVMAGLEAIAVRDGSRTWRIRPGEIIAARAAANYTELMLRHGRCILARVTLSNLATALKPYGFVRIHRGWVVNPDGVIAAQRTRAGGVVLALERGIAAPVSRRHRGVLAGLLDDGFRVRAPRAPSTAGASRVAPGASSARRCVPVDPAAVRDSGPSARQDRRAGGLRKYLGRCHCGDVRFTIEADLESASACDCSLCRRRGGLMHRVEESCFELLTAWEALTRYKVHTQQATDYFCRRCGILPFRRPRTAPHLWAVNVRCLEGVDLDALAIERAPGSRRS